jgi:hypothetical protein
MFSNYEKFSLQNASTYCVITDTHIYWLRNVIIPLFQYNLQPDENKFLTGGQAMRPTHLHSKYKPVIGVRKFRARLYMQNAYLFTFYRCKIRLFFYLI